MSRERDSICSNRRRSNCEYFRIRTRAPCCSLGRRRMSTLTSLCSNHNSRRVQKLEQEQQKGVRLTCESSSSVCSSLTLSTSPSPPHPLHLTLSTSPSPYLTLLPTLSSTPPSSPTLSFSPSPLLILSSSTLSFSPSPLLLLLFSYSPPPSQVSSSACGSCRSSPSECATTTELKTAWQGKTAQHAP